MSNINISLIEKLIEKTKHHSLKWVKLSESNMQLKPLAENPFGLMKQAIGDDGIYYVNNENSYISSYANGTFALLLYDAVLFNTYYDRQFNNWLHKYIYKKDYDDSVGRQLRNLYESAKILTEQDFKEELKHVLSNC